MRGLSGGNIIAVVAIVGWVIVTITRIISRNRVREVQVRERIAMIEKGLVPPPEVDPAGFERAMGRDDWYERRRHRVSGRHRRAGVVLMGVGFGFMVLVGLNSPSDFHRGGLGVGGFLAILGLAFFLGSLFEDPREPWDMSPPNRGYMPGPRAAAPAPPSNPPQSE
jgi:hypothetical protein